MLLDLALFFAAAMAFTYLGYPALAFLLSRLAARAVKKGPFFPSLSVILPVHNEAGSLRAKIDNLLSQDYPPDRLEIIVVDDGSTDGAVEELPTEHAAAVTFLMRLGRCGKASALKAGAAAARGDVLVFTDARQQVAAGSFRALAANFADASVTGVTGRLESAGGGAERLFRRYEEALRRWEAAWASPAGAAGALYAVRPECVAELPVDTILDDLVISLSAASKGRLAYEPEAVAFERPESAERTWSRRVRTLAGNWQIVFHPFKFAAIFSAHTAVPIVCHKLMRLLFPFFAAGLVLCVTALLPATVVVPAAAGGALAFIWALRRRRAGSAAPRHILWSLLIAPLGALVAYIRGRETVLWAKR